MAWPGTEEKSMKTRGRVVGFGMKALMAIFMLSTGVTNAFSAGPLPGGTLNPTSIRKYVDPLPVPGVMSKAGVILDNGVEVDSYEVAVRQFQQQVLSSVDSKGHPLPLTTVWGYGTVNPLGTFHYPAFSIEARVNRPVRVKWMNHLVDGAGHYLPHLLPVDQTLHWANPSQMCADGVGGSDCAGFDPAPYSGPVPIVVHLHGSHVNPDSDGYPEAWFLPAANNIPAGYATRGSNFGQIPGAPLEDGAALYQYRNDQRATTLWFHDHALGMTRANVYAASAGFYLLRGGVDDLPSGIPGSRLRYRTGHSMPTARSSFPPAGHSSTGSRGPISETQPIPATFLRSGIPSSSATRSWSMGRPGRT